MRPRLKVEQIPACALARPSHYWLLCITALVVSLCGLTRPAFGQQQLAQVVPGILPAWPPLAGGGIPHPHANAQPGYLGVSLIDLNSDLVKQLHLKDAHGALIVSVDGDAPAASAGLRTHDVVVEINGERISNTAHLRHKLHEMTAGATIALRISRDGAEQAVTVQLGNETDIAERAWEKHFNTGTGQDANDADPQPTQSAAAGPAFVPPTSVRARGSSFLGVFSINSMYTGAELDPLSTQLADYFGVHDGAGLLVRTVNEGSPAAVAGLRAGDVILRVNNQAVVSREDWTKQLHANRGHSIQLSVMRNHHEQTMTMTPGSGKG